MKLALSKEKTSKDINGIIILYLETLSILRKYIEFDKIVFFYPDKFEIKVNDITFADIQKLIEKRPDSEVRIYGFYFCDNEKLEIIFSYRQSEKFRSIISIDLSKVYQTKSKRDQVIALFHEFYNLYLPDFMVIFGNDNKLLYHDNKILDENDKVGYIGWMNFWNNEKVSDIGCDKIKKIEVYEKIYNDRGLFVRIQEDYFDLYDDLDALELQENLMRDLFGYQQKIVHLIRASIEKDDNN